MELKSIPQWKKYWKVIQKRDGKMDEGTRKSTEFERKFLKNLINKFTSILSSIGEAGKFDFCNIQGELCFLRF